MLLVVFGAGASFDSVHDLPAHQIYPALRPSLPEGHFENDRPPLANQLFDNRTQFVSAMARFPACLPLIPMLRKPGIVVERELARIQAQAEHYPQVYKELAAIRYYLHFAIWECQLKWQRRHSGITNYATFLRELDRWRGAFNQKVCLVTFNYDTMLDQELQTLLHEPIKEMGDYAQENYSLIKLHGSINWGRKTVGLDHSIASQPNLVIEAAWARFEISNEYRIVTQHPMTGLPNEPGVLFPAISIPVVNKDEFSCPETHVRFLMEMLPKVTKIITIGWRATEANFLTMLHDKIAVKHPGLMIVSGDDGGANETHYNLTGDPASASLQPYGEIPPSALNPGPCQKVTGGFTGLINNLDALEAFLRS